MQNTKKNQQLGMSLGKANNILKKKLLFVLSQELHKNICYRCNNKIESVEDFSIEHIVAWLDSDDPLASFLDINNITFSHLRCNIVARNAKGVNLGESHPSVKLTDDLVLKIRQEYASDVYTQKELAEKYGIHRGTISKIVRRRIWKHL